MVNDGLRLLDSHDPPQPPPRRPFSHATTGCDASLKDGITIVVALVYSLLGSVGMGFLVLVHVLVVVVL